VIFEWNLFSVVTYFVYFSFDRIIVQELVSFIYPFFLSSRYHDVIVLYYISSSPSDNNVFGFFNLNLLYPFNHRYINILLLFKFCCSYFAPSPLILFLYTQFTFCSRLWFRYLCFLFALFFLFFPYYSYYPFHLLITTCFT
jgi:hypothetical protein